MTIEIFGRRYFQVDPAMRVAAVPVSEWSWKPHDAAEADRFDEAEEPVDVSVQTNYAPSSAVQDVVLVFSTGVLNKHLLEHLPKVGLKYFFLEFDDLPDIGAICFDVMNPEAATIRAGDAVLLLRDIAAVIWTPPLPWRVAPATVLDDEAIFFERWRQVLRDLRGMLRPNVLWLPSHPFNGSPEWQNKVSELVLARRVGLAVPDTICTNDPAQARAFIDRHDGRVLFREFTVGGNGIPPRLLDPEDRDGSLESLGRAPCSFQAFVDKEYEVRALCVGDKILACKIDSSASARAKMDWRVYDNANVPWSRMDLPEDVERAIRAFLEAVSLTWACVDLVKGTDGRFYFLEANRPGSSAWFLPFVGINTAQEIAEYLKSKIL